MFSDKNEELALAVGYTFDHYFMTPRSIYSIITLSLFTLFQAAQAQDKMIDSLLAVLKTLPEDTNRVICLYELAASYGDKDVVKQIEVAYESLTLAKRINYEKGIAEACAYLGGGYAETENFGKSIEYFLMALRIQERRKDLKALAPTYHDIGTVYVSNGKFEKGIQYYQKAVTAWEQVGNKRGPVTALYNLGYAYDEQGKDTLALKYYNKAIKAGNEIGHSIPVIFSSVSASAIYLRNKNYTVAKQFADEAFNLVTAENNYDNILAEIYGIYSEIYLAQGKSQEALAIVEKGLAIAKASHKNSYILQNYKRLADIYNHTGNPGKAYEVLLRYTTLNDSIRNVSNRESIEQVMHGYELEKKDIQMAAQTAQFESGIFRRNSFIVLLIGLLVIALLVYNRTKLVLAARQQQLKYSTQSLLEKSKIIAHISEQLTVLKNSVPVIDGNMEKFGQILQLKIHTEEDWENFKKAFDEVYPGFFNNLRYKYPGITAAELRLAAMTKLNLSIKEAASMLGISTESVKQSRYRLKKRIGVPEDLTLKGFLEAHV
ncbi:tetratricopeptide repeat protein [Ohtaekwangia kribbensis]|jgi:tetratricopeptide (TPR) repeat protein|uniref:Tetratricopeptide repeat protein n=1 Tax=Ohtaekwangia kribbensis TaxID=688913 RepID=A0ABW3JVI5_9BACT